MRAIDDLNRRSADAGQSHLKLETIVGGELLREFIDLGTNLWPSELNQSKDLLELFLTGRQGAASSGKLCGLLAGTLSLEVKDDAQVALFVSEPCRVPVSYVRSPRRTHKGTETMLHKWRHGLSIVAMCWR